MGAIAATAGCLDFILGDDLSFSASEASVSDAALRETDYEQRRTKKQSFEKSFEVGGESRSVEVTNVYAEYDRSIDLSVVGLGDQRAATFTAAATPKVDVLGQSFNPIKDMSPAEIIGRAQNRYDGFGNLRQRSELTVSLLGKEANVTRFTGDAELSNMGQTVEIELQVSEAVGSGDDYVLAVGGYPRRLSDRGRASYETLAGGVQHDG
ncbi:hypothetical protein L593_01550 [Salinarchaeum sp. Harcht-Bsk1]|nr:hypothetical protein L593_01550 [Salinarchaeum sp. Harcht-Bsk1]